MSLQSDALFLQAALELAAMGRNSCAPNPPVGCIVARHGTVIGRGFHQHAGHAHAEVNALADAGGDVAGATVYVTLEPCAFVGRTPACAQTLIDAKVGRVVVATQDPHPQVAGKGCQMLRDAGIEVVEFDLPEAQQMIAGFVSRITRQRPRVVLKSASSLDGAVALASGESQWITGAAARKEVQQLRAQSDAVITGAGTVAADDPQLNVRDPGLLAKPLEQPLRVVLDSALRAPSNRQIFSDHTLVVHGLGEGASYAETTPGAVEYLPLAGGPRNLAGLLEVLAQRGCNNVLVEAGPKILGSFLHAAQEAPLWDEWICYIAPMAMGSATLPLAEFALPHLADAQRAKVVEHRMIGEDLQLRLQPAQ
ncbi:MAG TPA: bifunctional diaminohydroxyphosphoribosylaminopyrimidine deaminase/5-amino-6-(5-phosphoribosylamino)uracil reductase RibD [Gammaproteobacteria bacterium]|nr:bifunctional diaminohydroxyphosphoribosylaminopyrimidine deaminase/5-amino-6-(5-phosphoribosylamino)uracil reductase RibD [Gammaproteobacteria bacterium]